MDYHETKVREAIREACYRAIEINESERTGIKESGNPYAAVETEESLAMQINGLTEQTYKQIMTKTEKGNALFPTIG